MGRSSQRAMVKALHKARTEAAAPTPHPAILRALNLPALPDGLRWQSRVSEWFNPDLRIEGHVYQLNRLVSLEGRRLPRDHYNNPVRLIVYNNPDWRKVEIPSAGNYSDTTHQLVQRVADELLIERVGRERAYSMDMLRSPDRLKAEIEACLQVIEATLTHGLSYIAWRRRKTPMWAALFDVARAHAATLPVKILPSSDADDLKVLPVYTSEQDVVYGLAPWEVRP